MGNWITNARRQYRNSRDNLLALKQCNITLRQIPHLMRELRLWLRVTKNFREIEGSLKGALHRYLLIFQGRPRK